MTTENRQAMMPKLPKRKHGVQHPASSARRQLAQRRALDLGQGVRGQSRIAIQKQKAGWRKTHNRLIPLKDEGGQGPQRPCPEEASTIWGEEASSLARKALGRNVKSYGLTQCWPRHPRGDDAAYRHVSAGVY